MSENKPEEAAAVWVNITDLTPWIKNPRKNDEAAKAVAKSIKRFGFGSPIIARKADGEVIAGHTRLKAAVLLGLAKVPVRYLDLDPAEAHLLALADNRIGEKAEWDNQLLGEVMSGFSFEDIEIAGWSQADLDKMAADLLNPTVMSEGEAFGAIPAGDKEPFQSMTFTVHDSQVDIVKSALEQAKSHSDFSGPNDNSNGNALTRVCEGYIGRS